MKQADLGLNLSRKCEFLDEMQRVAPWADLIVDATLISAPRSTKNRTGERDPEMRQTKKGSN